MNRYTIRVNNATIEARGSNEYKALESTGIFKNVGNIIDYVRTTNVSESFNNAWIYEVELNGQITIAYIRREA